MITFRNPSLEGDMTEALASIQDEGARASHAAHVAAKREKAATSSVKLGLFMAGLAVLGLLVGIFTGLSIFVCGAPFLFIFGAIATVRAFKRKSIAGVIQACNSPQEACERFYRATLVPETGGTGAILEERMLTVAHLFPLAVLQKYEGPGWEHFFEPEADESPTEGGVSMDCVICGKELSSARKAFGDGLNPTLKHTKPKHERGGLSSFEERSFLKCRHCASAFCFDDICYNVPVTARYVCRKCGNARLGWEGLVLRWNAARLQFFGEKPRTSNVAIDIKVESKEQPNMSAPAVVAATFPNGMTVQFHNTAICQGEEWFLVSPEPGQ